MSNFFSEIADELSHQDWFDTEQDRAHRRDFEERRRFFEQNATWQLTPKARKEYPNAVLQSFLNQGWTLAQLHTHGLAMQVLREPKAAPKAKPKRKESMNLRTAALAFNSDVTSCTAYWANESGGRKSGEYTWAIPLSVAAQCTAGDWVVIQKACGELSLNRLSEVHEEPQFDLHAAFDYGFVIARVPVEIGQELESETKGIEEVLVRKQNTNIRNQIAAQFGVSDFKQLKIEAQQRKDSEAGSSDFEPVEG